MFRAKLSQIEIEIMNSGEIMRALLIVVLFLSALCCRGGELPSFPFIYVTGTARAEVEPDTAVISFEIKIFSKTVIDGVKSLNTKSQELKDFFIKYKFTPNQIKTYEVNKRKVWRDCVQESIKQDVWGDQDKEEMLLGYEFSRKYVVTMNKLELYGKFVESLLLTEDLVDIYSRFDTTQRRKIEEGLTVKAVADARKKAEDLSKAAGCDINGVFAISENSLSDLSAFGTGGREAEDDWGVESDTGNTINKPDKIVMCSSVNMIYKICHEKYVEGSNRNVTLPLGSWKAIDFVKNVEEFKPDKKAFNGELYLKQFEFKENGVTHKPFWTWKDGYVYHSGDKSKARYLLKNVDGVDYLFLEWINGDVLHRGQKPHWYVFKRSQ